MKSLLCTLALFLLGNFQAHKEANNYEAHIQVAILLDTSGSMSGLIEQAKSQLWSILNTLSSASKNDQSATIEMALYEYGNDGLSSRNGWVSERVPFTSDVDRISESLFSMSTNGGSEFCGTVIKKSLDKLHWNESAGLRVIYIAGNEPFTQGSIDYRDACKQAVHQEVIVNTIFCGRHDVGISTQWQAGAVLAKGSYHNIDHNQETVYISSPYDDEIAQLNTKLNDTYVSYTKQGERSRQNMNSQDTNAGSYSKANYVKRSIYKSKAVYDNSSWDLVDAYAKDNKVVEKIKYAPRGFESTDRVYIEKRIQELSQQRKEINSRIQELALLRKSYIKEHSTQKSQGLEEAILSSVKQLLIQKQFQIN